VEHIRNIIEQILKERLKHQEVQYQEAKNQMKGLNRDYTNLERSLRTLQGEQSILIERRKNIEMELQKINQRLECIPQELTDCELKLNVTTQKALKLRKEEMETEQESQQLRQQIVKLTGITSLLSPIIKGITKIMRHRLT
jgi:chromosome segregation ATPase